MSSIERRGVGDKRQKTIVQPVFVGVKPGDRIVDVVFSPDYPDTCVVLYEINPPVIHDLIGSGVRDAYYRAYEGKRTREAYLCRCSQESGMNFRSPAVHAAYQPLIDRCYPELSIVFGEGDSYVHRLHPRQGKKVEPFYFDNPVRVSYAPDGKMLAAGSNDGNVSVFATPGRELGSERDEDDEAPEEEAEREEGRELTYAPNLKAAVRALCVQEDSVLRVATDRNALFQFALDGENEWHTNGQNVLHSWMDGVKDVSAMKLNALVWSSEYKLLAFGGVGGDLYLVNPAMDTAYPCHLKGGSTIRSLQFVPHLDKILVRCDDSVQLVSFMGDADSELVSFLQDATHNLVYNAKVERFLSPSADRPIVGAYYYGKLLIVVHAVTESGK
ncbi:MAG: hypothetical protein K2W82_16480 [Candidatus Obscuribacterales bacterium]|nr:hypothetical protein [Candidatus Obscuribacterales bacterium]